MTSLRHTPRPNSYLDAARAAILDLGWRRTTLTEVARRAGVSRMTIYRTWPDMTALLADLMTREWGRVVSGTAAPDGAGGGATVDEIADRVVRTVHALREDELFTRIVELDPELLLPYLLSRRGRSQDAVLDGITGGIREGQAAGEIRSGRPVVMARALVLALHGFVISAHTMVDDEVSEEDLDAELRALVGRVLR